MTKNILKDIRTISTSELLNKIGTEMRTIEAEISPDIQKQAASNVIFLYSAALQELTKVDTGKVQSDQYHDIYYITSNKIIPEDKINSHLYDQNNKKHRTKIIKLLN